MLLELKGYTKIFGYLLISSISLTIVVLITKSLNINKLKVGVVTVFHKH